eukprot:TRINITY_DN608_c1_g1_i1.p1 TRINITY_DN608_c1_g1~~TRINITY_DN608_c1_g1_i1.p1  ORF type:complete len:371 (+),score=130.03 TRINITY_DN608_c1_g1_i1:114-1226(+)
MTGSPSTAVAAPLQVRGESKRIAAQQLAAAETKKVGKYKLCKQIGRGGFSVVYKGVDSLTRATYAVKMCEKAQLYSSGMLAELENEIAVLKKIRSRHIANLVDVIQTGRYYYLVLDLCVETLFSRITRSDKVVDGRHCLEEADCRRYFQGLMLAVYACHQMGVMHRDIKPENILITRQDEIKLSDFGFATPVEKLRQARAHCGTRQYLAPEVFESGSDTDSYDGFSSDVWACGVTLYVMGVGRLPFGDTRTAAARRQLRAAQFALPQHLPPEMAHVITSVLMPDPSRRPTVFQVMEMSWFLQGFNRVLLDDINNEVRQQRAQCIMHERFSRHVPAALLDCPAPYALSSPPVVDSFSATCGDDSPVRAAAP